MMLPSELNKRFNPEGSPLRNLQHRMTEMLLVLDDICRRHDIPYWMESGTLLGCVRHGGFIPWDDDIDVGILRRDYLRLLKILPQELPDWLELQTPDTDPGYFFPYAKLRDRRSRLSEVNHYDRIFHMRGIYIDIFPFERAPQWLRWIGGHTLGHVYRIMNNPQLSDEQARRRVRRLYRLNERLIFPFLRAIGRIWPKGDKLRFTYGIPYNSYVHYSRMFPLTRLSFEGHLLSAPNDSDDYLRCKYGDYMQLPNLDKLKPHIQQTISFDPPSKESSSPVAIFVYNRLANTRKTLSALMQNTLAAQTDVYVFSDGGRDKKSWQQVNAVRQYLQQLKSNHPFRSLTLVLRSENIYLERNIMEGIAYVLERHDRICVLEDDIVTSPFFLQFINDALNIYKEDPRVMHVGGFTNLNIPSTTTPQPSSKENHQSSPFEESREERFYFTPHMSGWGWATWRNRWQQHFHHFESEDEALALLTPADIDAIQYGGVFPCLKSLRKNPIPWDCCWEIAIHRAGGLCLYPTQTLVRNIGLRGGTHFSASRLLTSRLIQRFEYDREPLQQPVPVDYRTPAAHPALEDAFREAIRDWGIRYTWLGRFLRWLRHKF